MRRHALGVLAALVLALLYPMLMTGAAQAADGGPGASGASEEGREVVVGTEGTYPPFSFNEDGRLTGYDVEVMKAVAKEAGWRLRFVQSQFDALFGSLDSGRVDVIANQISVNPEREARYTFSEPYAYSRGVIVAKKGSDIRTLADLKGLTTAQSATSNWSKVAKDAGAKVENVDQFAQAADLVARGRVDAIVNDNIAVLDYLATTGDDSIEVVGDAGDEVGEQALAFRKDDQALAQEADRALDSLRADGTLARLSEKYFKADVSVKDGGDAQVSGREAGSWWDSVRKAAWPSFVALMRITIPLTAISFAIGLVAAVLIALARISRSRLLSVPARVFISAVRGTPLLLQLYVVFFALPQLGVELPSFLAAVLALSINVAGYAAETVRGALLAVPAGQHEAAATIGMSRSLTLRRVVLPQAARVATPPLSNTLVSLVKDTSLVSVVLLTDPLRVVTQQAAVSFDYLPLFVLAGLYYWVVCTLLTAVQDRLETRLNRYVAR